MQKEELEKMFDEKYFIFTEGQKDDMKNFWFKQIIPEVLKSLLPQYKTLNRNIGHDFAIDKIKQKAKELYNIII